MPNNKPEHTIPLSRCNAEQCSDVTESICSDRVEYSTQLYTLTCDLNSLPKISTQFPRQIILQTQTVSPNKSLKIQNRIPLQVQRRAVLRRDRVHLLRQSRILDALLLHHPPILHQGTSLIRNRSGLRRPLSSSSEAGSYFVPRRARLLVSEVAL